jgi:DUF4097 and DUF4098 domain-containing protein YvlB
MRLASRLLPILVAFTILPACSMHLSGSSYGSVSERGGVLYLDDTPLEFEREVEISQAFLGSELRLATQTGDIDVTGSDSDEFSLVIDLFTEFEDDGEVRLENGQFKTSSLLQGEVLINGIRGTVPAGASLHVQSGTGRIVVRGLSSGQDLDVDTGTGSVFVNGGVLGSVRVNTGTGDLRLDGIEAEYLKVSSGTGHVVAQGCRLDEVVGDSGTGDFIFKACQVEDANMSSGTGDVDLDDTLVTRLKTSLGTGDVSMSQGGEG